MGDDRDDDNRTNRGDVVGRTGEDLAAAHLREKGWTVRSRNVEMKIGEIDIVASREETLGDERAEQIAFVEVKSRASSGSIPAEVNVTYRKRRKLATLAKIYLDQRELHDSHARFDIVTVDFTESPPEIAHYPAAFDVEGRYN